VCISSKAVHDEVPTAAARLVPSRCCVRCAGRLFGLIARGQGQDEDQAARHAEATLQAPATAGAPQEPPLQSGAAQQQAAAVEGHADRPDDAAEGTAATDAPEEPVLQSDVAQQQAVSTDGQTAMHATSNRGAAAEEGALQEPALQSDVAQHAAAPQQGMPGLMPWPHDGWLLYSDVQPDDGLLLC